MDRKMTNPLQSNHSNTLFWGRQKETADPFLGEDRENVGGATGDSLECLLRLRKWKTEEEKQQVKDHGSKVHMQGGSSYITEIWLKEPTRLVTSSEHNLQSLPVFQK